VEQCIPAAGGQQQLLSIIIVPHRLHSTPPHRLLPHLNPDWFYLFWYRLTQFAFSALTLLVGQQEGHPPVKTE